MRIFIADGDLLFRALLRLNLQKDPTLHFAEAGDGFSAFRKIKLYQPDLIIADANLNLIAGLDLLKALHNQCLKPIFTVLLSSMTNQTSSNHVDSRVDVVVYKHALCAKLPNILRHTQKSIEASACPPKGSRKNNFTF